MINSFIDIGDFKIKQLRKILDFAKKLKKNELKFSNLFKNKSLIMLFEKESLRTRLSFSIGMQKLGGLVIELEDKKIGYGSRESEKDILKTFSQYADVLMIRNNDHDKIKYLASLKILPIINGLSNFSHPCQTLSDIFTIEENIGSITGKTIAWFGDFNNVTVSLIEAAEIFKFNLDIFTPLKFHLKIQNFFPNKKLKYTNLFSKIKTDFKKTDCVMTDVWISMGEKNNLNKKKLLKDFQVNSNLMAKFKKDIIFMHCLPAHRNQEVTDSIIDSKQSIVWKQAKNRIYVQQSILNYLIK